MDKAKLIEYLKEIRSYVDDFNTSKVSLTRQELDLILTSLTAPCGSLPLTCVDGFTDDKFCDKAGECEWCRDKLIKTPAPVPDGKECEECAAKQNKIEELNNELEMTVDELKNYRDELKECRNELRDSHRY